MDGAVHLTSAVVLPQSQVAAGVMVDTLLPCLPAVLQGARAEGLLHLLVPVCAVTVAVASAGGFEQQPLQGLLHRSLIPLGLGNWRGCGPACAQAGLYLGHRLLSGRWHGCLRRNGLLLNYVLGNYWCLKFPHSSKRPKKIII